VIGRPRRHRSFSDDVDPGGLHVFIPGALASGFLVSIGLLVSDAVRRVRGDSGATRAVTLTSAVLAEEVRAGTRAARGVTFGMRSRRTYAVVGAIALGISVATIPGATWNFFNPVGYIGDISSIWVVSLLLVIVLLAVGLSLMALVPESASTVALIISGIVVLRFLFGRESDGVRLIVILLAAAAGGGLAALTWRWRDRRDVVDVPPLVRRLLRATPLGVVEEVEEELIEL